MLGANTLEISMEAKYIGVTFRTDTWNILAAHYQAKARAAQYCGHRIMVIEDMTGRLTPKELKELYMARVDCHLIHGCEISPDSKDVHIKQLGKVQIQFLRQMRGYRKRDTTTHMSKARISDTFREIRHISKRPHTRVYFPHEVISMLGLTSIDAGSGNICRSAHGATPVVNLQPDVQWACFPPSDPDRVWSSALPWDPSWGEREIRDEECWRVCWAALSLVMSFRIECSVSARR
ncbi:hypothetical protein B0H13DRAFT_2352941 [Mycena leptocephala]|nr:hypothetical protein B0H13DRAFT_2352941 [Mycena leptocephala]